MNLKSRILIVAVALLAVAPLAYAGRGPDEMQFRQRIQKMDKLIEQADSAKTPAEHGHLLDQHMQEMRACMNMMNGGGAGMSKSTDNATAPMNDRMMQMEQRMEMMQMMMDQMMKQQERSKTTK